MKADIIRDREPTAEDCEHGALIKLALDGRVLEGHACWYPQMGGYGSKAFVMVRPGGCADVLVWHDGEFPFGSGGSPRELHHCSGEQFIEFGKQLEEWGCKHDGAPDD